MRKVVIALGISLLTAMLPIGAYGASEPDEHWSLPRATINGQVGVGFDDRQRFTLIGALRALVIKNGVPTGPVCKSLTDSACAGAEYFSVSATLGPCRDALQVNCIDSLSARKEDGTVEKATFVSFVSDDESLYWKGDEANFIPDSKVESIWNFPTITHSGGKDFLLNSVLGGSYTPQLIPNWTYSITMLQPVSKILDSQSERPRAFGNDRLDFMSPEAISSKQPWAGAQRGGLSKNCAANIDGACFRREPFPSGISFSVAIRTNSQVGSWIHGRMKTPEVSMRQNGNSWLTTVGGQPTEVPVVAEWFDKEEDKKSILSAYSSAAPSTTGVGSTGVAQFFTNYTFDSTAINRLSAVRPFIKDTASANPKIWAFETIPPLKLSYDLSVLGGRGGCVRNATGLAGVVTTNATVYDGSIPIFDEKTQTLNYLVSAPHYSASGSEFLGTYDLVLRSDIARCIYGFEKTPTSATVSIVKGDTVEKVSTTTLVEKDGWLSLSAYGFTFSSPKISVKLNQPKEETQAKVENSAPTTPVVKQPIIKTINCSNSKGRKTIKGVNPKCPKGYKLIK